MSFNMKYTITPRYLTAPSQRRSGILADRIRFVVAHDTGNPNSTAAQNVRYYENSRNELSASAHLFVDDKEILECIPALTGTPEKAWHVRYNVSYDNQRFGVEANDAAIGVELCFSTNGSIDNEEAYRKYVWLLAYICYRFGLNPANSIVGHEQLDPARRSDPSTALRLTGRTFSDLVRDVVQEYNASVSGTSSFTPPPATAPTSGGSADDGIGVATVLVDALNVRSEPSMDGSVVKVVSGGEVYKVFYEKNGWYNVGGNQWISSNPRYVRFRSNGRAPQQPAPQAPQQPSGSADGIGIATILADALNVRSEPSINGSIVKVVNRGEAYKVFYEKNGWYNVGGNQWISANPSYVRFTANRSREAPASGGASDTIGVATILADALNVRSEPSLNGAIVKVVNQGESYRVFYEKDGWYNVGGNQWISANPKYVRFRAN
ncbi:MAG: SH3 domain-containing protein [Ectobacillus sp.]